MFVLKQLKACDHEEGDLEAYGIAELSFFAVFHPSG